jgi:serine-type D-Ala-D-Ala carboxypeptidase/endopeptidase
MIRRRDFLYGAIATSVLIRQACAQAIADDEVGSILRDRIGAASESVGIVAVTFTSDHEKLSAYGRSGAKNDRPLDGDTVFEIGSITKVFTTLLLAEMVTRGEVALDDPVAKYLPDTVKMPARNEKQITLLDLATYTSGLPRLPDGIENRSDNPYAAYTIAQLYAFLSNYTLRFDPGAHYEYANLGFGLLGHVLALRANASYEDLVVSRICVPLGLEDTRITLNTSMRERLAQGHLSNLQPTSNWDFPTLPGAGALRSTANDLVKFVKANRLSNKEAPLRAAMDILVQTRRPTDIPNTEIGLGWFIRTRYNDEMIWKIGRTGGYTAFAGFSNRLKTGAVVLSNSANSVNDIGLHLANSSYKIIAKAQREPGPD